MTNGYSSDDLLDFLGHASERGLMPAATARALAVASRNVLGMLTEAERADLRQLDLDAVARRFARKRSHDFNPSSVKEYERRVHRAVELFLAWRNDPASFSVKTRATTRSVREARINRRDPGILDAPDTGLDELATSQPGAAGNAGLARDSYRSAFPIRPGRVVSIVDIPTDLTVAEAERLATFVRMLAVE